MQSGQHEMDSDRQWLGQADSEERKLKEEACAAGPPASLEIESAFVYRSDLFGWRTHLRRLKNCKDNCKRPT